MAMRNREDDGMITKVVSINRVSKTVKGGRIMKFAALVVVGDGKGTIGYGIGKSGEVPEAIRKGEAAAKKNMLHHNITFTKQSNKYNHDTYNHNNSRYHLFLHAYFYG